MIRIDAIWLATEQMDMRAGTETAMARVIAVSSRSRRCSTSQLYTRLSAKFETWSLISDDEYARKMQPP